MKKAGGTDPKKFCIHFILCIIILLFAVCFSTASADTENLYPNEPSSSNLNSSDDIRQYALFLDQPGSLAIRFQFVPGGDYMVKVQYADNSGNLVKVQEINFFFNKETVTDTVVQTGNKLRLPAGMYYISVYPYNYSGFRDDVFTLTPVWQAEPGDEFEKEFNDAAKNAMRIMPVSDVTGCLSSNDDVDYYRFTLPASGLLEISFRYVPGADNNVTLYKANDNGGLDQIQKTNFFFNGESITDTIRQNANRLRLPSGEYFIEVSTYNYNGFRNDDYLLSLRYTDESSDAYEVEFNNTAASATKFFPAIPITGNLNSSEDEDYYCFSLSNQQTVKIKFEFVPNGDYNVILFSVSENNTLNQYQKINFFMNQATTEPLVTQFSDAFTLNPGNYYLSVSAYNYNGFRDNDYILTLLSQ